MQFPTVKPAVISQHRETAQFTPVSVDYEDKYYSAESGLAESQYVFLTGNNLPKRWQHQTSFCIAELGFGTGLNFFATWLAWQQDPDRSDQLIYFSVEMSPLEPQIIADLGAQWPELKPLVEAFLLQYPAATPGHHCLRLAQGRVIVWLCFGDASTLINEWQIAADAWYLDGFAPSRNSAMWSANLLKRIGHNSKRGTSLATFTAAGQVRRDLIAAGFVIRKTAGFNGKRERITAVYEPPSDKQISQIQPRSDTQSTIYIIGAGIAALHLADALLAQGCAASQLQIIGPYSKKKTSNEQNYRSQDSAVTSLDTTSHLPAAIVLPQISGERTVRGYLHWQAFAYARQAYAYQAQRLADHGIRFLPAFRQLPPQFAKQNLAILKASLLAYHLPPEEAELLPEAVAASDRQNTHSDLGQIRYSQACCIDGQRYLASLAEKLLDRGVGWHQARLLEDRQNTLELRMLDSSDERRITLSPEDDVVYCMGARSQDWLPDQPLHTTRGQLNRAEATVQSQTIDTIYSRHLYVTPAMNTTEKAEKPACDTRYHYLGSTFDRQRNDISLDADEAIELQDKWQANRPDLPADWSAAGWELDFSQPVFAGLRLHSADRMPLVGQLPDEVALATLDDKDWQRLKSSKPYFATAAETLSQPRRWVFTAMGAHGFSLSPILAVSLATTLLGRSQVLQKTLLRQCHPLWQRVMAQTQNSAEQAAQDKS